MKRFIPLLFVVGVALIPVTNASAVTIPEVPVIPPINPVQLKVDLCHNGTIIPISINAVGGLTVDLNGHGLLTLSATGQVVSFVKADGEGHSIDAVLRVYLKHGNDEVNLDVESGTCDPLLPVQGTIKVCLAGVIHTFGPGVLADVTAAANAFIEANAGAVKLEGDDKCEAPTTPTTVPTTTPTTVPETPTTTVPTVVTPILVEAPTVGAPSTPSDQCDIGTFTHCPGVPHGGPAEGDELPRTGSSLLLGLAGAALIGAGSLFRYLTRR